MDETDRTYTGDPTLERYGDQELWVAHGENWSFPLHVTWKLDRAKDEHYGLVAPACGAYKPQELALNALLQPHDIRHGQQEQWLIPRQKVETLLCKAPGITPKFYYKWDVTMPYLPVLTRAVRKELSITSIDPSNSSPEACFIRHISEGYGIPNSVVRIVMRAIREEAPRWMVEGRQPLDLGFCKLIAAPFRANWKEIVTQKFKKWRLLNMLKLRDRKALDEAGVPEALCSVHNVGIKKGMKYKLDYTIEAIPTTVFDNIVNVVEAQRQASVTVSYVASFEKTVEKLYPYLLQALESYCKKTQSPFARVYECGAAGRARFLPTNGQHYKVRGHAVRKLPVRILENASNFSVFGEEPSKFTLIRPKAAPVPKVSNLPSPAKNMRGWNLKRGMAKPRSAGTVGVLLPDAAQGTPAGEPVLPGAEIASGDTSGLDRNGDS